MLSATDIIASLARLTNVGRTSTTERATPAPAPESASDAPPALTIVAPLLVSADTLLGLSPPPILDALAAARSVASANFVARVDGLPSPKPAPPKPQPRFGFAQRREARPVEPPLSLDDIRTIGAKLRESLAATPDIYLLLVNPSAETDQRSDVFASCILNAAMIPGWPPPPLQTYEPPDSTRPLAVLIEMDEGALLEYAVALGLDEVLSASLAKLHENSTARKKLLCAALTIVAAIGLIITALRCEVEDILVDFGLLQSAAMPAAWGGRIRLPLE